MYLPQSLSTPRWRIGYPTLNPSGAGASALPRVAHPRRLCRQTGSTIPHGVHIFLQLSVSGK